MPRDQVYQLRLSKREKDELAEKARIEGCSIAKLIRWRCGLDVQEEPDTPGPAAVLRVQGPGDDPGLADFPVLVAKHKRFMSTRSAEARARQELERTP